MKTRNPDMFARRGARMEHSGFAGSGAKGVANSVVILLVDKSASSGRPACTAHVTRRRSRHRHPSPSSESAGAVSPAPRRRRRRRLMISSNSDSGHSACSDCFQTLCIERRAPPFKNSGLEPESTDLPIDAVHEQQLGRQLILGQPLYAHLESVERLSAARTEEWCFPFCWRSPRPSGPSS